MITKSKHILFRLDGNAQLGTGHFSRCGALARCGIENYGVTVSCIVRESSKDYISHFFPEETDLYTIKDVENEHEDAALSLAVIQDYQLAIDIIILDHYGLGETWEELIQEAGVYLFALDDCGRDHKAHVVLEILPPYSATTEETQYLQGTEFALLSGAFVEERKKLLLSSDGSIKKVLVCFGGADPTDETVKVLSALEKYNDISVDVVVGAAYPEPNQLEKQCLQHKNWTLYINTPHIPKLMAQADIAIGAGGVMLLERMAMGLPSLVISVADNQIAGSQAIHEKGCIDYIGHYNTVSVESVNQSFQKYINNPDALRNMAQYASKTVDGEGGKRVWGYLLSIGLLAREATQENCKQLYEWRNHHHNVKYTESGGGFTLQAHQEWFRNILLDPKRCLLIVYDNNQELGVVRFDIQEDNSAILSIYLVPSQHGNKRGLSVYFAAERYLKENFPFVVSVNSKMHKENTSSIKLHNLAGFTQDSSNEQWYCAYKKL